MSVSTTEVDGKLYVPYEKYLEVSERCAYYKRVLSAVAVNAPVEASADTCADCEAKFADLTARVTALEAETKALRNELYGVHTG